MPRPPDGSEPRTLTMTVRLTPTGLRHLDAARGFKTRSEYVRALIARDVQSRHITVKEPK